MKHSFYAIVTAAALVTSGGLFAQSKLIGKPSAAQKNVKVKRPLHNHLRNLELPFYPIQPSNPPGASTTNRSFGPEVRIGQTLYDLQTNNSVNYRLENFGDGTLSALWTFSNQATAWSDRGMAYHQFDGTAWTRLPDYNDAANIFRIEDARTGFGSLARVSNVGDIVVHTARPEWRAGKVIEVTASQVKVIFPDGEFQDGGDMLRPFRAEESRLVLAPDQNNVRLKHLVFDPTGKTLRVTFDQGLRSFQRHYANFNDPRYLGSKTEGERRYKELATKSFQELLGADRLRTLVAERDAPTLRLALREVQKPVSNLLHSTEVSRLSEAEQNDDACVSYGAALDDLLRAETLNEQVFERYVRAAKLFVESAKSGGPFTWPLATFFPFLAAPDRFIFLKPDTSRECAACEQTPSCSTKRLRRCVRVSGGRCGVASPLRRRSPKTSTPARVTLETRARVTAPGR